MYIQLVGAGSLGLLFAGKLAACSQRVSLVARSREQQKAAAGLGIEVDEPEGIIHSHPEIQLYGEERVDDEYPDWLLLTVKQTHLTKEFLDWLTTQAGPNTGIVCFQNGIGHAERLFPLFGMERVYLAVTTEAAKKESHHRVRHTGIGSTTIGPAWSENQDAGSHSAECLIRVLNEAGYDTRWEQEMLPIVWNKLLINSVINPLTAILRVRNGELLSGVGDSLLLMKSLYEEGLTLATSLGIAIPSGGWERLLEVCQKTAANRSSMLQDLEAGRATEIEAINGSLLRLGERAGLTLPVNRTVYLLVKGLETGINHSSDKDARYFLPL